MLELYLFRHGLTDWNAQHRLQGHQDIPLNARGREQARELAVSCEGLGLERIVSSDLARALETARCVGEHLGVPVSEEPALREACMGQVEGLSYDEILERFGDAALQIWRDPMSTRGALDRSFPGGESLRELIDRVWVVLDGMARSVRGTVGISTHGGVLRHALTARFPEQKELLRHVPNAAAYAIEWDGVQWRWLGQPVAGEPGGTS